MRLVTLREAMPETRVALTPKVVERLIGLGFSVGLEPQLGKTLGISDESYQKVGAEIATRTKLIKDADVVVALNRPNDTTLKSLKEGTVLLSLLDPFRHAAAVKLLQERNVSSLCMELIPRTTYAQKMDVLSSQASLAGYAAVILAAERIDKVLPMMSTPAGTIAPARVFIIGAGVAGLQAIATAKRLGARVEAYDTRPVVAEQVHSLGAKFVQIDVGETGQTEQGYAKALSDAQLERQRQGMAKVCAHADIVITTAQLFGKPAPRLLTSDMVAQMRPGSVIVDLAASTGGNVEGTVAGKEVDVNGVKIIGHPNLPGTVARDASEMYASNVFNLIAHLWDKEAQTLKLDLADETTAACLLTYQGEIRHDTIRELAQGAVEA